MPLPDRNKQSQTVAAYDHYCRWLTDLGIAPAVPQEYERVTAKIVPLFSFAPHARGHYGTGDS